ncbi:MAG: ATP-dependent zinc metalloprotease FtsH [Planctomycetia bacterium]|nr:ATP-dependent zinc metalloprotease FtsH [Planctomycetia bacterium]
MENQDKQPRNQEQGFKPPKGFLVLLLFFAGVLIVLHISGSGGGLSGGDEKLDQYQFEEKLRQGQVKNVRIDGHDVSGDYVSEGNKAKSFRVTYPEGYFSNDEHLDKLRALYVENARNVETKDRKFEVVAPNQLTQFLFNLIPWIILLVVAWFLLFRQMRASGPGSILAFGRSRARMTKGGRDKVTFDDVAGCDEAKEEVREVVEFLKDPQRFQRLGGRMPRGILLVGAPGTGKTLMAKAVAGEADVPFYAIGGSDFVEMFVGVGASRVRDLFRQAKENSPSIIFLDEIDAVGRRRGVAGFGRGDEEREQTLNAILVEMDGFDTDDSVIVIASTNRPDILDPALLRPGRFDREIVLDLPDVKGREEILRVHSRKVRLSDDIDLSVISRTTPGFSGADLEALINEAALIAVMKRKESVEEDDLEEARDKVRWGRQKRSRVMDLEDKKITAYHEAGHAAIASLLPEAEPVHKVTIIPRGVMGGATMFLPEKDRHHYSRKFLLAELKVLFAGRLAEEEFCGDITAGAQNDFQRATEFARRMVCEWGMSDLGPVSYVEPEDGSYLGRESRPRSFSEASAVAIDAEIRKIVTSCYDEAKRLLQENREKVERIAKALLKYEVLDAVDVKRLMEGVAIETLHEGKKSATKAAESKPADVKVAEPRPAPGLGGDPSLGAAPA